MSWVFYATLCLFVSTGYKVFNQHYKINASILMLYRGIGLSLVVLPIVLIAPHQPKEFYYYAILLGFIISFMDNLYLKGVSKFGAGPISRVSPLYILASLVIWWIISPEGFYLLLENKLKLAGVIFSIITVVFALFFIKSDKLSNNIIKYCFPIYIGCICIDVFAKLMFNAGDGTVNSVYSYMCVSSFVAGFINLMYLIKKNGFNKDAYNSVFEKRTVTCGLMIIIFIFGAMYGRNNAVIIADNPAYVSAFTSMSPVIIALYNKFVNFEDKTNKVAGFLIVFGCIMLSFFAK